MSEIGYQSGGTLTPWQSITAETHETNPLLIWPQSIDVFDKMRREDSQVGSVLRAVMFPIRRAERMIDPAGCRDEVVTRVATDLGLPVKGRPQEAPLRTKGRFSFDEFVRLVLLMLVFGHSIFEQVYEYDEALSQHRLVKLAWRPPRTISDFKVAKDGGLVGIHQHDVKELIEVARLVVFVNEREGGNWAGVSLLRQAYKNWLLKDRYLRIQALVAERNGLGLPVYTGAPPPAGLSADEAKAWNDAERKAGLELVKSLRAGESAGAFVPGGGDLKLMGVTGSLPNVSDSIAYQDEQIARAVLAHVLNLGGNDATGSYNLSDTLDDIFTDSLNAISQQIDEVVNQHVIEDLVDKNWGPEERAPRLVTTPIGTEQPATAEAIRALLESGAIKADPALEAHLRAKYGLPIREEPKAGALAADPEVLKLVTAIATVAQKLYLATDGVPLAQDETRALLAAVGVPLGPTPPGSDAEQKTPPAPAIPPLPGDDDSEEET